VIHRALTAAVERYKAGERSADVLRHTMWQVLATEPLAEPEYVSVASLADGRELSEFEDGAVVEPPALLSMAVRFGEIRLIDNERLE
jgi:pantoate--beta-alanine ligase